jgi:hypothetical protein
MEYEKRRGDCYFKDSILPNEIILVYEPWHKHYFYIKRNAEVLRGVLSGEFDYLLDELHYGMAIRRIK